MHQCLWISHAQLSSVIQRGGPPRPPGEPISPPTTWDRTRIVYPLTSLVRPVSFSARPPRCFPEPETVHSSTVPPSLAPGALPVLCNHWLQPHRVLSESTGDQHHPGGEAHGQEQGHQYTGALAAASSPGGPRGASTEAKGRGSSMGFFKSVHTSPAHCTH